MSSMSSRITHRRLASLGSPSLRELGESVRAPVVVQPVGKTEAPRTSVRKSPASPRAALPQVAATSASPPFGRTAEPRLHQLQALHPATSSVDTGARNTSSSGHSSMQLSNSRSASAPLRPSTRGDPTIIRRFIRNSFRLRQRAHGLAAKRWADGQATRERFRAAAPAIRPGRRRFHTLALQPCTQR